MREHREIVKLWERGDATALATLVRVEGSSYRLPGARLLLAGNGEYAGAISGGCLETEVIRKAQWLVRNGATVQRYSTLFDDTADIPYGLGCGGTVDVLLEPAGTPEFHLLLRAMQQSLKDEGEGIDQIVQTLLPVAGVALQRWCVDRGNVVNPTIGTEDSTFTEVLSPPQRLIVFGAGDDARPLVQLAVFLGWTVLVVDGRSQWARAERFPGARRVLVATGVDDLPPACLPTARDAVVVMTHSYEGDRLWLTQAMQRQPRYLGLLGSRHRSALLVSEAAGRLRWPLKAACERLFAPVGLDLGGDGAEAIALATIAEIQACLGGKLGHSRRMTPAVIGEQIAKGGASRYLQAGCAL